MTDSVFTDKLTQIRREFHRFPELSWKEEKTAQKICQELDALGIKYKAGVAKHGIVAEIPGKVSKPFIALRADMDALPIQEETNLEFSSTYDGVMHACAHDGHMTAVIGAAELLLKEAPHPYPIRLIFQPAEEKGEGAKAMVAQGVLDDVAMIFGGHFDRHYPTGTLVVTDGPVNASTDEFAIEICGQGGHGARPHESVDAIVVGSLMVMAIQTIVSREVNPAFPSVVSIGEFKAGHAPNVIAGSALLKGTIRAQHHEIRTQLQNSIVRIARSIGELHSAKVKVQILEGTPPLSNEKEITALARKAAIEVVGEENVVELHSANMGGEDFSYFLEKVPGCYIRYGSQLAGRESFPAHSSRFDFDENALTTAASFLKAMVGVAAKKLAESES